VLFFTSQAFFGRNMMLKMLNAVVGLTLALSLANARLYRRGLGDYPEAVCNDGTEAAYFHSLDEENVQDIVIWLQGGGACHTEETCSERCLQEKVGKCTTGVGTRQQKGILSDNPHENPPFHDYYKVWVHYCSSDLFIGNRTVEMKQGTFYFRGQQIMDALIRSLDVHVGISRARNVVLTGTSAGGIGTVFNCNQLQALLPDVSVRCIPDGAPGVYAPDLPVFSPECQDPDEHFREANAAWNGNQANFDPHSWWTTIIPPLFIGIAKYDTNTLGRFCVRNDADINAYGEAMLQKNQELVTQSPHVGIWSPSCFAHPLNNEEEWYNGVRVGRDGLTYAQTLQNWVRGEGPIHVWDECSTPLACNPTCV